MMNQSLLSSLREYCTCLSSLILIIPLNLWHIYIYIQSNLDDSLFYWQWCGMALWLFMQYYFACWNQHIYGNNSWSIKDGFWNSNSNIHSWPFIFCNFMSIMPAFTFQTYKWCTQCEYNTLQTNMHLHRCNSVKPMSCLKPVLKKKHHILQTPNIPNIQVINTQTHTSQPLPPNKYYFWQNRFVLSECNEHTHQKKHTCYGWLEHGKRWTLKL